MLYILYIINSVYIKFFIYLNFISYFFTDIKDTLESQAVSSRANNDVEGFSLTKRKRTCGYKDAALNYLSSIGVDDIFDDISSAENDPIVMERKKRADKISRSLSVK